MGDESSGDRSRVTTLDPNRGIRMKTSTLITLVIGVAACTAAWLRLETVVANQGEKLTQVFEDIRTIKQMLNVQYRAKEPHE